jgi:hypothetical protein
MRSTTAAVAAAVALAAPATASANHAPWHWSWGHNYIGGYPSLDDVTGRWNYWYDQYIHKHSGDEILRGWVHTNGNLCGWTYISGAWVEWYRTAADLGCGGYIANHVEWSRGNSSYLYADSVT